MTSPLLKASAVSLAGSPCAAITTTPNHGDESAERLQRGEPDPKENARAQKDKRGNRALNDREVERARMMRGDVEERDEGGVSGRAHDGEIDPARAKGRPVLAQRRTGGDQNGDQRHRPPKRGQGHRPDLADRQSPDDRVGGPNQRGATSSRIGLAQADCMSPVLGAVSVGHQRLQSSRIARNSRSGAGANLNNGTRATA